MPPTVLAQPKRSSILLRCFRERAWQGWRVLRPSMAECRAFRDEEVRRHPSIFGHRGILHRAGRPRRPPRPDVLCADNRGGLFHPDACRMKQWSGRHGPAPAATSRPRHPVMTSRPRHACRFRFRRCLPSRSSAARRNACSGSHRGRAGSGRTPGICSAPLKAGRSRAPVAGTGRRPPP